MKSFDSTVKTSESGVRNFVYHTVSRMLGREVDPKEAQTGESKYVLNDKPFKYRYCLGFMRRLSCLIDLKCLDRESLSSRQAAS